VFETISSPDTTRHTIPEDDFEEMESFVDELGTSSTWQNDILSRQSGDSDVVTDIKQLCRQIADSDEDVSNEAEEILELLNDREMSDWAESQLRTIHRRRRRYGTNGTIRRIHHKLTEEIEFLDPETVPDADVALTGQLDGGISE
jgi:hypothetical protein